MNTLKIVKLQFSIAAVKDFRLVGRLGDKIRGALGEAMFALYCVKKAPECFSCEHRSGCVYGDLFKPALRSSEFATLPAPYVIDAPFYLKSQIIKKGEELFFSVTIFGKAVSWQRHVILSAAAIFERSSGVFNDSFELKNAVSLFEQTTVYEDGQFLQDPRALVWSDENVPDLPKDSAVRIRLLSPVVHNKEKVFVPEFPEFIDAVFYRIAGMIDIYEEKPFTVPYGLLYRKPHIRSGVTRHDNVIEEIVFRGDISRYMPYIDLGSYLHIGKKSTYGFGSYEYELL